MSSRKINPYIFGSIATIVLIAGIITADQVQDIMHSGHAPAQPSESAIIGDLEPGKYTAILRGVNNTTRLGLVEMYDFD